MKNLVFLIVALVGALPGVVHAETVDVGGVTLEIPAPNGYTSINGQPALFDVWRNDTHSSATLLAGFMSNGDFDEWLGQKDFDYGFYNAFAQVDRSLAALPANQSIISAIAEQTGQQFSQAMAPAFVDGEGGGKAVNPDLAQDEVALVSFQSGPRSHSHVLLSNSPADDYPVSATAQVLVEGRVIDLVIEGYYESDDDIAWIQRALAAWVDAVIAANE